MDGNKATIAFQYQSEGFRTDRSDIKGRHVAGEEFIKGYARHTRDKTLFCYAEKMEHAEEFQKKLEPLRDDALFKWIPFAAPTGLREAGSLFIPGPGVDRAAWRRRRYSQRDYSIIGVTHTTASEAVVQAIGNLHLAPIQPWDALVCTSRAVSEMVQHVLTDYAQYLKNRLSATEFNVPRLPVIPLGVHCQDFAFDANHRGWWRRKLGIAEEDIVFLFKGRLSFHAKSHPFAMYTALEKAARETGRNVHLIQSGWFSNDFIEEAFKEGALKHCPSVTCHFVDGNDPDVRYSIWSAADVFTSLSDNVQETFGLTPIEAMASGLPCVVSNWDGYRDTVIHDKTGIMLSTWLASNLGEDFADRYQAGVDSYDLFCGRTSQHVAVDIDEAVSAYKFLIENEERRKKLGENGRRRAKGIYDWKQIVKQYENLSDELADIRNWGQEIAVRSTNTSAMPLAPDPFLAFRRYASHDFSPKTMVRLTAEDDPLALFEELENDPMTRFVLDDTGKSVLRQSIELLNEHRSGSIQELCELVPPAQRGLIARSFVWLAKYGIAKLENPRVEEQKGEN